MRVGCFILLALVCSGQLLGQAPFTWRITTDDGLKTNMVYDMQFDQDGKVWFGLFGGIASYNGHKAIMHAVHEDLSMSCTNLQFGDNGDIYFMNFSNEIFRYNRSTDSIFKLVNNPLEDQPSVGDYILVNDRIVLQGTENLHYASFQGDTLVIDSIRKSAQRSKFFLNEETETAYSVIGDSNGLGWNYFLNHETGVVDVKVSVDKLESIFYPSMVNNLIFQYNRTKQQLNAINVEGTVNTVFNTAFVHPASELKGIYWEGGFYWLSLKSGVYVLNDSFQLVDGISQPILSIELVSQVDEDRQGNIWISTTKNGVFVIPNVFMLDMLSNNEMNKHVTKAIALKDGGWIMASEDHVVYEYDAELRLVKKYKTAQNEAINGLIANQDEGEFWASGHLGVEVFKRGEAIATTQASSSILNPLGVKHLTMAGDIMVMPSWSGVYLLKLKKEGSLYSTFESNYTFDNNYLLPRIQYERALYTFYDSRAKDIWVQHPKTPIIYGANDTIPGVITDGNGKVAEFNMNKCVRDSQGFIWIASSNHGLLKVFDRQIEKVFRKEDGLKSNTIFDIALQDNDLWLCTFEGLQKLNVQTGEFSNYGVQYGIKELPYQTIVVGQEHILISHSTACLLLNRKQLKETPGSIPIAISQVEVNKKDTALLTDYQLSHTQNNISIHLSSFYYSVDKYFAFEYRDMGNRDGPWNYVPAEQGKVQFYDLKPGTYKWEFRAITSFGLTSAEAQQVTFTILPPYYRTPWFQILMALFFLLVIGGVVALRIKAINKRNSLFSEKAAVEAEKQKLAANLRAAQLSAIKAQLNPHFMFNALNSIQEFILLNHPVQANKFLGKFSDLMRLTLDNSNAETITLADELKMLTLYLELEALRFEENFSYTLDNQVDHPASIEVPAMLIQPYVENAIKHGLLHKKEDRKLKVSFTLFSEKLLQVVIEDNGIGRANAAKIKSMRNVEHKSYASSANQKRLELLNTGKTKVIALEIEDLVENDVAVGTKVTLRIPF